jgi:hypothetical protein
MSGAGNRVPHPVADRSVSVITEIGAVGSDHCGTSASTPPPQGPSEKPRRAVSLSRASTPR